MSERTNAHVALEMAVLSFGEAGCTMGSQALYRAQDFLDWLNQQETKEKI